MNAIGTEPELVVALAKERGPVVTVGAPAADAMAYARDHNIERTAVIDERALLGDALERSMGSRSVNEIQAEFERLDCDTPSSWTCPRSPAIPARHFTTPEMIVLERENVQAMRAGPRPVATLSGRRISGGTSRITTRT